MLDRNLPSAMKSRPKIPRTPINEELLSMIRRENESIIAGSTHIRKNEDPNKKKKTMQPQQQPQHEIKTEVNIPENKVVEEKR